MVGASLDDIFVIILFTFFTTLATQGSPTVSSVWNIPLSIIFGGCMGWISGLFLHFLFQKTKLSHPFLLLIILSVSFLLITLEEQLPTPFSFSALLAVFLMAMSWRQKNPRLSKQLSTTFSNLWVGAEILLFTLVGTVVNIQYITSTAFTMMLLLLLVLLFRSVGVLISLLQTPCTIKERLFCVVAYTVQASIGALPLSMGLACGEIVVTGAVLAILLTAPLGAIAMDRLYPKLLSTS